MSNHRPASRREDGICCGQGLRGPFMQASDFRGLSGSVVCRRRTRIARGSPVWLVEAFPSLEECLEGMESNHKSTARCAVHVTYRSDERSLEYPGRNGKSSLVVRLSIQHRGLCSRVGSQPCKWSIQGPSRVPAGGGSPITHWPRSLKTK